MLTACQKANIVKLREASYIVKTHRPCEIPQPIAGNEMFQMEKDLVTGQEIVWMARRVNKVWRIWYIGPTIALFGECSKGYTTTQVKRWERRHGLRR